MKEPITTISSRGDELETLRALRWKVSDALDRTTSARDIAALSRQLQQIISSISELETRTATTPEEEEIEAIINSKEKVRQVDIRP